MKILGFVAAFGLALFGMTSYGQSQDAEVPGDNFSLEGALELFKKSRSPEEFEKDPAYAKHALYPGDH